MKPQSFLETGRITADQVKTSQKWLDGKITEFNKLNLTPRKVLNDSMIQMVTSIMPGKMYMYSYDPKFKETLPYYDKFPLVLPFARTQESFTGLNLHYLSYDMRIRLFKELLKISGTTNFDESTKIKYSWGMIKAAQKLKAAQPCVKMYLFEHLASPLGLIPPSDWYTAMMLPVQRFVGASKEHVWAQNRKYR